MTVRLRVVGPSPEHEEPALLRDQNRGNDGVIQPRQPERVSDPADDDQ
jgi:hypothetical protein